MGDGTLSLAGCMLVGFGSRSVCQACRRRVVCKTCVCAHSLTHVRTHYGQVVFLLVLVNS